MTCVSPASTGIANSKIIDRKYAQALLANLVAQEIRGRLSFLLVRMEYDGYLSAACLSAEEVGALENSIL